ncbi:MAG: PAS domain S-box protein [Bacteroidales bacterium]
MGKKDSQKAETKKPKKQIRLLQEKTRNTGMDNNSSDGGSSVFNRVLPGDDILSKIFFQNTTVMYIVHAESLQVVEMNEAGRLFYGLTAEKVENLSETELNILPAKILKQVYKEARECKIEQFDFIHRDCKGGEKYVQVHSIPIEIQGESYHFNVLTDISSRRKAEEELRASEAKYREMVENMPVIYFETDMDMQVRYFNRTGYQLTEYQPEDIAKGLLLTNLLPDESLLAENFRKALQGERKNLFRYTIRKKNGNTAHVMIMSLPLIQNGKLTGIKSIGFDVTHQLEIQEQLKKSEEKFSQFTRMLPETVFEIDISGNFLFLNDHSYQVFGYSKEDPDLNAFNMFIPSDRPRILRNIETILRGGNPDDHSYTALRKDGSTFPVLLYSEKKIEQGHTVGFRGFIIDVTDRVESEKALQESEEKYRTLTEKLPVGIYRTTTDGRFIYFNRGFAELLGYDSAELTTLPVNSLYYDKNLRVGQMLNIKDLHGPFINELMLVRKNGEIIWVKDSFRISRDETGNILYLDGIIENITQTKILENRLKRAEKLEAIGSLAGGIAHDFNNLLMGMQLYTELAIKAAGNESVVKSNLERVLGAQIRGKQLVQQILNFSRQPDESLEMINPGELLEEAIQIIRPSLPAEITLDMDFRTTGLVRMNPLHLHQITMNLVTNAIHALEGRGTIRIELLPVSGRNLQHRHPALQPEKNYAQILFSDTGHGIDDEIKARIFDPFFTTKKTGMGTGLGLSIVQSILNQYEGEIFLESIKDQGTKFYIYLPISDKDNSEIPVN